MTSPPIVRGHILVLPDGHRAAMEVLAKEAAAILRALRAEAVVGEPDAPEDFVLVLAETGADVGEAALPDLRQRAGSALGFAASVQEGRVATALARKRLRAAGAHLGARELVFTPDDFGILGLERDALRERLEILLQALVLDAERLRLAREGWEEP